MKNGLAVLALLAVAVTAAGQTFRVSPAEVSFSVAPYQEQKPITFPTYGDARAEAILTGKPLVVWLGYPPSADAPKDMIHWHTAETDWHGYSGPGVIVSIPSEGRLLWVATLPASDCGASSIRAALGRSRVLYRSGPVAQPRMMMAPMMGGGGRRGGNC